MTQQELNKLGSTLWAIADDLRGSMNADDFRDYMLSFLFLRYLLDNYEAAAQKELGPDYPNLPSNPSLTLPGEIRDVRSVYQKLTPTQQIPEIGRGYLSPLSLWYAANTSDVAEFENQMRRKVHYVIEPQHLWSSIAELARTQNGELLHTLEKGFKYIENQSFDSTFQGLFSEINLNSEKLGKTYTDRNAKLCTIISKIAAGIAQFSTDSDILGDAYEYLIGQFAAGSGKKAGEFYTPQ